MRNLTTGVVTTSYYLGGSFSGRMAAREGTTLRYIHQDSLGSTSVMSDPAGASISSISYFPFGLTRTGSVSTSKQFTGQRLDGTGLYYYGARYYDASIGRFISADTEGIDYTNPQSLNRYTYCSNNPLKYTDPTGHSFGMTLLKIWHIADTVVAAMVCTIVVGAAVALVVAAATIPGVDAIALPVAIGLAVVTGVPAAYGAAMLWKLAFDDTKDLIFGDKSKSSTASNPSVENNSPSLPLSNNSKSGDQNQPITLTNPNANVSSSYLSPQTTNTVTLNTNSPSTLPTTAMATNTWMQSATPFWQDENDPEYVYWYE